MEVNPKILVSGARSRSSSSPSSPPRGGPRSGFREKNAGCLLPAEAAAMPTMVNAGKKNAGRRRSDLHVFVWWGRRRDSVGRRREESSRFLFLFGAMEK